MNVLATVGMWSPVNLTTATLVAGGYVAFHCAAHAACTIASIRVRFNAITTPGTCLFSMETLNANDQPSGSLWATNTNGSATVSASGANTFTLTASATFAAGDKFAFVMKSDTVLVATSSVLGTVSWGFPGYRTGTAGPTWGSFAGQSPQVDFLDGSGNIIYFGTAPTDALPTVVVGTGSTPDEYALAFTAPFTGDVTAVGADVTLSGSGRTFRYKLYDAAGSTVLASVDSTDDIRPSASAGWYVLPFATRPRITKGVSYVCSWLPLSASTMALALRVPDGGAAAIARGMTEFDSTCAQWTRTDGGAWTVNTAIVPQMGLQVLTNATLNPGGGAFAPSGIAGRRRRRGGQGGRRRG